MTLFVLEFVVKTQQVFYKIDYQVLVFMPVSGVRTESDRCKY